MPRVSGIKKHVKFRKRNKTRTRRRLFGKTKYRPRFTIRTSPSASPNVYHFKRSYDHPFAIGVADSDNGVLLNHDSTYMVVKLHTKFNKLPDYSEFKALFSEYKITSITHRLVPFYKQNIGQSGLVDSGSSANYAIAIPNYEVFAIPVNSSAREDEFHLKTGDQIGSYLNQSQRKGRRIMPSRTQKFHTMKPKVVGYKGPLDKDAGTALMCMQSPAYLNTDPSPLTTGGVDQTDVIHYGVTLLIRRVDGLAMNNHGAGQNSMNHFGFRMENDVFFKVRKVQ